MTRVEMDPAGDADLQEAIRKMIVKLSEAVRDDARDHFVPVRTGHLRDTIRTEFPDYQTGQIGSDLVYAAPVEFGYHLVAWGHDTRRWIPPQPYLRPALFTPRSL